MQIYFRLHLSTPDALSSPSTDQWFPCYTKSKVSSNGVCNYYDFIRREGLSLAIWFDIVEFRENIHMTVKIFANVHHAIDVFGTKARMDTYRI